MNREIKYLVVPGYVRSADGDIHYIGARKLMHLYGVEPQECKVCATPPERLGFRGSYMELYPRSDGKYENLNMLPAEEME